MRRAWVGLAVFVASAFAGCAGAKPASQAADVVPFDARTGAIVGLVADDSLEPVVEARVVLDSERETVTGTDGRFEFPHVEPGAHTLIATKDGHADGSLQVEVFAGEFTKSSLSLVRLPSTIPYHATEIQAGLVGCSTGFRLTGAANNDSYANPCGAYSIALGPSPFEKSWIDWKVGVRNDDKVGFWGETTWRSTQALGSGMVVEWSVENKPWTASAGQGVETQQVAQPKGKSPLAARIAIELLDTRGRAVAGGASTGRDVCPADATCWLGSFHFPMGQATGQPQADFRLAVQQRYDDYLTTFHRGELPHEFSALPDS